MNSLIDSELTLAEIGEELDRIAARSLRLKYLWNTRAPISRLAPELLLYVLNVYKLQVEHEYDMSASTHDRPKDRWHYTYRWIIVSHVCRHWRMVALNSAGFWSSIYVPALCTPLEWIDELFRRTAGSTISILSLKLPVTTKAGETHIDRLPRLLRIYGSPRHIRRLQLSLHPPSPTSEFPHKPLSMVEILTSPIPLGLEELTIWDYTQCDAPLSLFSQFFVRGSTQLQSLSLKGYALKWGERRLSAITWDQFCAALLPLQQLRRIELINIFQSLQSSTPNATTLVAFPHLEYLILWDDEETHYVQFLAHLSVPPTTRIDIRVRQLTDARHIIRLFGHIARIFEAQHIDSSFQNEGPELQIHQYPVSEGPVFGVWVDSCVSSDWDPLIYFHGDFFDFLGWGFQEPGLLFRGLAEQLQSLTHNNGFPAFGFSFREEEDGDNDDVYLLSLIRAFSGFRSLRAITMDSDSHLLFLRALNSDVPNCNCIVYDIRSGSNKSSTLRYHGGLCQPCRAFFGSYFPELRTLTLRGTTYQKLEDEELRLLKRLLCYFDAADRRLKMLEFKGWGDIPIVELARFCCAASWDKHEPRTVAALVR